MNAVSYVAFKDELEKISSGLGELATHGAEVAGLGILAAPTIQKMRGKKMSTKGEHAAELGGLGVLAAPSAAHLAKHLIKRGSAILKKADADMGLRGRAAVLSGSAGGGAPMASASRAVPSTLRGAPATGISGGRMAGIDLKRAQRAAQGGVKAISHASPASGGMFSSALKGIARHFGG